MTDDDGDDADATKRKRSNDHTDTTAMTHA
jgi:hypothetical protein